MVFEPAFLVRKRADRIPYAIGETEHRMEAGPTPEVDAACSLIPEWISTNEASMSMSDRAPIAADERDQT
jgi:hypothetical protein